MSWARYSWQILHKKIRLQILYLYLQIRQLDQQIQWQLHFGIHFGPVVAGVIGSKSIQYDFLGETVNTAFSICDLSKPNEILISNNAWMQSRNSVKVTSAGLNKLKGKTEYEIFKVVS